MISPVMLACIVWRSRLYNFVAKAWRVSRISQYHGRSISRWRRACWTSKSLLGWRFARHKCQWTKRLQQFATIILASPIKFVAWKCGSIALIMLPWQLNISISGKTAAKAAQTALTTMNIPAAQRAFEVEEIAVTDVCCAMHSSYLFVKRVCFFSYINLNWTFVWVLFRFFSSQFWSRWTATFAPNKKKMGPGVGLPGLWPASSHGHLWVPLLAAEHWGCSNGTKALPNGSWVFLSFSQKKFRAICVNSS